MKKVKIITLEALILTCAIWLSQPFWKPLASLVDNLEGQATLSWDESEEKNVTYKIYYGETPRDNDCPPAGYAKSTAVKKGHDFTAKNLEPGKTYYFSVSAVGAGGKESCFSHEMSKKIPGKPKLFWEKMRGKINKSQL